MTMTRRRVHLVLAVLAVLFPVLAGVGPAGAQDFSVPSFVEDLATAERTLAEEGEEGLSSELANRLAAYVEDARAFSAAADLLSAKDADPFARLGALKVVYEHCAAHPDTPGCREAVAAGIDRFLGGTLDEQEETVLLAEVERALPAVRTMAPKRVEALAKWLAGHDVDPALDRHEMAALLLEARLAPEAAARAAIDLLESGPKGDARTERRALLVWLHADRNYRPDVIERVLDETEDDTAFVRAAIAFGHHRSPDGMRALLMNLTRRAMPAARAALRYYEPELDRYLEAPDADVRCLAAVAAWVLDAHDRAPAVKKVLETAPAHQRVVLAWIVEDLESPDGPWHSVDPRQCLEGRSSW